MKKIYTFTLDGEDYPSCEFDSNLRLFAYMLYETVYYSDEEAFNPLDINKEIVYNNIHEDKGTQTYYLDSDIYGDSVVNYEPFIVGNKTVAFTVNDDLINRKYIEDTVNYVLSLLKFKYTVSINTYEYVAKNINDERNRKKTIRLIFSELGFEINNKCNLIKKRTIFNINKRRMI